MADADTAVLLVTHDLDPLRVADKVYEMTEGALGPQKIPAEVPAR